jgi:hypothetical protein
MHLFVQWPNISSITSHSTTPTHFLPCIWPSTHKRIQTQSLSNSINPGNSTYAGATAAIVANIVLLSYVVVAFNDDKSEREADLASGAIQPSEGRKDR